MQLFAFGPVLVENGEVEADENTEVGKAMASNPRTAIGIVDELHYILVVADGRSSGYDMYYRICGAALAVAAGLANLREKAKI